MNLTDDHLQSLAGFLSRRLRTDLTPVDPFDAPDLGDTLHRQWERQLRRARVTNGVPRLIRAASRALPDDPALREASALAAVPASTRRNTLMMLTSTALVLLATAFGSLATTVALAASAPDRPVAEVVSVSADMDSTGLRADGRPGDLCPRS